MRNVLASVLFLLTTCVLVQAEDRPPVFKTLSPYFVVDGGDANVEGFPLKSTDVVANITGVIADVTVTQVYENHGQVPINAKYVFPGSTRAAVHGMRIRIGQGRRRAHQGTAAGHKGI
jgi:Ca-activated chloride channel family protein